MNVCTLRLRRAACPLALGAAALALVILLRCTGAYVLLAGGTVRRLPVYSVERADKAIAITFDCAWGTERTDAILQACAREGVRATFFMVEFWAEKYPDYVRKIDGAGHMRIMWQIVLPQAMPLATVVVLNSLILQWNSWANASIFLSSNVKDIWPLALMIRDLGDQSENFMGSGGMSNYNLYLIRYAVIIAGSLPMLCIFPFFQKKMESSVIVGAVKG